MNDMRDACMYELSVEFVLKVAIFLEKKTNFLSAINSQRPIINKMILDAHLTYLWRQCDFDFQCMYLHNVIVNESMNVGINECKIWYAI